MKNHNVLQFQTSIFDQLEAPKVSASSPAGPVLVQLDAFDLDRLKGRKVSLGSHGYAQIWDAGRHELLHRWALGLKPRDGQLVDHRNGDVLDCRRSNLRLVTSAMNSANRRPTGISGHLGVHALPGGRWRVRVQTRQTTRSLGSFDDLATAAQISHEFRLAHIPGYVGRGTATTPARHLTAA